jgi:hypothetical protein
MAAVVCMWKDAYLPGWCFWREFCNDGAGFRKYKTSRAATKLYELVVPSTLISALWLMSRLLYAVCFFRRAVVRMGTK